MNDYIFIKIISIPYTYTGIYCEHTKGEIFYINASI